MSDFCLECFNKFEETAYAPKEVRLSLMRELCEGCGETRRVVIGIKVKSRDPQAFWLERSKPKKTDSK